jgi:hypothetical protein
MGVNDLEVKAPEAESQPVSPEPEAEEGAEALADDVRGETPEEPKKPEPEKKPEQTAEFKPEEEPITYERFSKVYGRMRHLERELERARAGQPAERPPEPAFAAKPKPETKDFDSDVAYYEALSDWKIDQRLSQERFRASEETARRSLERKIAEGAAKIPAFAEKAYLPNALVPIVMHSEIPAELSYYWGEHPEEAVDLLELPREQQAYRIAQLEAKIRAQKPAPRTEPKTKFPEARGVDAVREGVEKPISQMSTEEYIAYMNKREQIPFRSR